MKICLAAWEWVEEKRGATAARRWRRKAETKTIATYISQGAVGGAIGYFLLVAGLSIIFPVDANVAACLFVPWFLVLGAFMGAIAGILVWLVGLLLHRRPNFFVRSVIVTAYLALWSLAFASMTSESQAEQWTTSSLVISICLVKLPIVLMTGSSIRPCRVMLLGAGPSNPRHNFGSWLWLPTGFLLRVTNIFCLLEALMFLALWVANQTSVVEGFSAGEYLPAIGFGILYFAVSVYFSLWTPRKAFLLPVAILLCGPLAGLVMYLPQLNPGATEYLLPPLLTLIGLWAIYTLGRVIAPDTPRRIALDSWCEPIAPQLATSRRACQVQP